MTAQPLFQFGTVALDPAPDCRVVRLQAALGAQRFDIAERARVPKVPAYGAQNQLGLRFAFFTISSGYHVNGNRKLHTLGN